MQIAQQIDSLLIDLEHELEADGESDAADAIHILNRKIEIEILRTRATALRIEK